MTPFAEWIRAIQRARCETDTVTTIERTLLLLRHAKSDWSGSGPDIDRPLATRGLAQAPRAGRWLAGLSVRIDLALVSPARRARETWRLVADELDPAPPERFDDRIYAASGDQLLDVVRGIPDDVRTVLLVGHNPGMEQLASWLVHDDVVMLTSGIADIGIGGPWSELLPGSAVLRFSGRA